MTERILVVDDEPLVLEVLGRVLRTEGFEVSEASDGRTALHFLDREPFALLLCDVRMPGMDGFELVREVRRTSPGTDVVMMTGYGSLDGAIEAMSLGAADYLMKPLKPTEIVARIQAILERRRLEDQVHRLETELATRLDLSNVVASSSRMSAVYAALRRVAATDDPVVLSGEPGSGRKFIARAIHASGPRREQVYRCLRCDILPPARLAEELFENNGARPRRGVLARTPAGTVHLHSIESLNPEDQRRLAHRLESAAEPRLLLSVSAPLGELLESGALAPELRVLRDCVSIRVPALRDRVEDLPGLVEVWMKQWTREHAQGPQLQPEAVESLAGMSWPGNVRQLFAVLQQASNLSQGGAITPEIVARAARQADPGASTTGGMARDLDDREYQLVLSAVQRNPGRLDQAARELGISRTTLWRRMRKYGIKVGPGSTAHP